MDLLIRVEGEDPSDIDFLRQRVVGAVEELVEDLQDENRFDGKVEVSWDLED